MIDNLEYIKIFYYVAKLESITKAAETLNVSQPAVSQSIKQLEEKLNVQLVFRASRGVRLTREGKCLFEYVRQGYESIEQGIRKLDEIRNLTSGEIRIGASDMTLKFYLLKYLEIFHEKYPQVKVVVTNGPTPETLKNLKEGKIDFAVCSSPIENLEGIEVKMVKEIEDIFVGGRRFIAYKNRTLDFAELEKMPLICLEKNSSTRAYMDKILSDNGVWVSPEFELATSDMIVQFAIKNLGIGSVVKDFAREYLDNGTLFELRFNKIIPKRNFLVVTNEKMGVPLAARRLLELFDS